MRLENLGLPAMLVLTVPAWALSGAEPDLADNPALEQAREALSGLENVEDAS